MPQYRSNVHLYYQFKNLRKQINQQSLIINKLFHWIRKKSLDQQLSEESQSYLTVLKLIAQQKCSLPPQKDDAQKFVQNLSSLFFESLTKTTEISLPNDTEQINQQIKLALNHCSQSNEYDFTINNDDDDQLLCDEDVCQNVESNNGGNNCSTVNDSKVIDNESTIIIDNKQSINSGDDEDNEPNLTFIANNQTIIEQKSIENQNDKEEEEEEKRESLSDSSILLSPLSFRRPLSTIRPNFNDFITNKNGDLMENYPLTASTPMINRNINRNFDSISRISINNNTVLSSSSSSNPTMFSNSNDKTIIANISSLNEQNSLSSKNNNNNSSFSIMERYQSKKKILNSQNEQKLSKKPNTIMNKTGNNNNKNNNLSITTANNNNTSQYNSTFFSTYMTRSRFMNDTSLLNESYSLRPRKKKT
ncbi:uncharacterized protein LOC113795614 [Dermatophagoides pteronyssinus]|uniref:uncharacterized protein LOC113795614 n=1 Tax=Dermatophagoides pteronyssinus TaxID=6956 RepID=UPI003F674A1E